MDYSIAIATLKQADPILATAIDRVGDCLLNQEPRTGTLLDSLSQSIIYQQLSGKAAAAIHRRFLQLYPDLLSLTPEAILNTPDEVMRGAGLSRAKVLYIKDLAQNIASGLPAIAELESLDDESIIRLLTQVKGIGRWTVQMLLMFRLHRWDVLPVDDLGIRTAIRHLYQLEDLPNRKTVEKIGSLWKPYRTIACWYLWRSLDGK
ncbi:MAG: DNA-3-methyladenine glycosylase 2 family protein [Leptolyngbyaceae cyanobacterium CRU_2_3]|nr:DNA-3-methyladenine glycosylase 2 family protein [Leptolyngbyaceae cyanobacterium CRU_2_3]